MLLMLWVLKDTVVEGCFFHMWISLKSYWIMLRSKNKLCCNFALVNNGSCDGACLLLQSRCKLLVCTWDAILSLALSYKVQVCLICDTELSLCLWQCARLSFHMCQRTISSWKLKHTYRFLGTFFKAMVQFMSSFVILCCSVNFLT